MTEYIDIVLSDLVRLFCVFVMKIHIGIVHLENKVDISCFKVALGFISLFSKVAALSLFVSICE